MKNGSVEPNFIVFFSGLSVCRQFTKSTSTFAQPIQRKMVNQKWIHSSIEKSNTIFLTFECALVVKRPLELCVHLFYAANWMEWHFLASYRHSSRHANLSNHWHNVNLNGCAVSLNARCRFMVHADSESVYLLLWKMRRVMGDARCMFCATISTNQSKFCSQHKIPKHSSHPLSLVHPSICCAQCIAQREIWFLASMFAQREDLIENTLEKRLWHYKEQRQQQI